MAEDSYPSSCAKFFCDAMLGRLALWLRVMGFDVLYERDIDDKALIKRAISHARIILTRDTALVRRREVRHRFFFVHNDLLDEQLREVTAKFSPDKAAFFSRCLRCNVSLTTVSREAVEGRVPPFVFKTQSDFSMCEGCGRVYWPGTHRSNMREKIRAILDG